MTTANTTHEGREPITVTVDGQTWVFEPTEHPSDYTCGDLRLRDHKRICGGWSLAPSYGTKLYDMGVTGHEFTEPSPKAAMRAFLANVARFRQRREAEDEVLRMHGLLPPTPTLDARKAMVEEIMDAAETAMVESALSALNEAPASDALDAKAKLRAAVEKALGVTK